MPDSLGSEPNLESQINRRKLTIIIDKKTMEVIADDGDEQMMGGESEDCISLDSGHNGQPEADGSEPSDGDDFLPDLVDSDAELLNDQKQEVSSSFYPLFGRSEHSGAAVVLISRRAGDR